MTRGLPIRFVSCSFAVFFLRAIGLCLKLFLQGNLSCSGKPVQSTFSTLVHVLTSVCVWCVQILEPHWRHLRELLIMQRQTWTTLARMMAC